MYNSVMTLFLKKSTFYFLLAGTTIMIFLMLISGHELKTAATPLGIIDLELASSKAAVQNILDVWSGDTFSGKNLLQQARNNTLLDFIFLLFYASFLYSVCKLLARSFAHKNIWQKVLSSFAVMALLSGLLDVVENTGMLFSLYLPPSENIALITSAASYLKWFTVFSTLIVIVASLLAKAMEKQIRKRL